MIGKMKPEKPIASDEETYRILDQARHVARRREIYGRTAPRGDDLCEFDAMGMDIVEGRA